MKPPGWLKELVIILLVVLFIRTFVAQAYNIPSGSMQPTLLVGDFILVNKLVYRFSEPRRGDIVVFHWPKDPSIDFVKRIVGVPGDTVEIRGTQLYINGKPVPMRFVGRGNDMGSPVLKYEETLPNGVTHIVQFYEDPPFPRMDFGPITIPDGFYFVMGDNRDNSEDSRYWGLLPRENIVGKVFVIYFSGEVPPLNSTDVNALTGIRQILLALLNPRWDRIGKPLIW
ncbi:signal peptidase I [Thermocrinis albus DSM 14484]|uniref:Signal peptidase I n=1 Tax=Thermocrinis albus (strain DSM 14484 / JCM 11386 / HI 11/12) TaxID=638303 RepID=D3SQD1_THEAH|nr:signal peptidase I [Thermocrinis albus]ADC89368.1 signal peptidase I [Thermocrinis albus DSM 14484]